MNKTIIIGGLAVVIIAGIGYALLPNNAPQPKGDSGVVQETQEQGTTTSKTEKPAEKPVEKPVPSVGTVTAPSGISLADVAKHTTNGDCWIVVSGKAYDMTAFIEKHPGGQEAILRQCGKDATQTFMGQEKHSQVGAPAILAQFYQGDVR